MAKLKRQGEGKTREEVGRAVSTKRKHKGWNRAANNKMDAHQVLSEFALSIKTITYDQISAGFTRALNPGSPSDVKPADAVSDYVAGGDGVIDAFVNVLNGSPPFSFHHMSLVPGDVKFKSSVLAWANAIKAWYKKHGYRVNE